MRPSLAFAALLLALPAVLAQPTPDDPDWKELEAPAPPPLRTQGLIGLDMPRSELRFGVDPDSISVGADGIVRYVVVATSASGTVNGLYEGLRCQTGQVRVYARHQTEGGWKPVPNGEWKSFLDNAGARHTRQIARTAACAGRGSQSAAQIVRELRYPVPDRR